MFVVLLKSALSVFAESEDKYNFPINLNLAKVLLPLFPNNYLDAYYIFNYSEQQDILKLIKEPNGKNVCVQLANLLALASLEIQNKFDLVTHIPSSKSGSMKRLFSTGQILANCLSKQLGIPCKHLIVANKKSTQQKSLKEKDRKLSAQGKYAVKRKVQDLNILLVDDIITTGSSMIAASKALYLSGAKSVTAIALAHSIKR